MRGGAAGVGCVATCVATLALAPAVADADTVGFDDLAGGTIVSNQYQPRGAVFGPQPSGPADHLPVVTATALANSSPNVAALRSCDTVGINHLATTTVQFTSTRASVDLVVGNLDAGTLNWTLSGLDSGGSNLNTATVATTGTGVHTHLALPFNTTGYSYVKVIARGCDAVTPGLDDLGPLAAPLPPAVATGGASAITASSALLSGTVNPNGVSTDWHFEFGPSGLYGSSTPSQNAGASLGDQQVSQAVAGLSPSALYHYRLVASSARGTTPGADSSFTTLTPGAGPVASFRAPATIGRNQPVVLSAAATRGTGALRYFWDFDGSGRFADTSGTSPRITHAFAAGGDHKVTLRAVDPFNRVGQAIRTVHVALPPLLSLIVTPTHPRAGQKIKVSIAGQVDRNIGRGYFEWSFGDGRKQSSTLKVRDPRATGARAAAAPKVTPIEFSKVRATLGAATTYSYPKPGKRRIEGRAILGDGSVQKLVTTVRVGGAKSPASDPWTGGDEPDVTFEDMPVPNQTVVFTNSRCHPLPHIGIDLDAVYTSVAGIQENAAAAIRKYKTGEEEYCAGATTWRVRRNGKTIKTFKAPKGKSAFAFKFPAEGPYTVNMTYSEGSNGTASVDALVTVVHAVCDATVTGIAIKSEDPAEGCLAPGADGGFRTPPGQGLRIGGLLIDPGDKDAMRITKSGYVETLIKDGEHSGGLIVRLADGRALAAVPAGSFQIPEHAPGSSVLVPDLAVLKTGQGAEIAPPYGLAIAGGSVSLGPASKSAQIDFEASLPQPFKGTVTVPLTAAEASAASRGPRARAAALPAFDVPFELPLGPVRAHGELHYSPDDPDIILHGGGGLTLLDAYDIEAPDSFPTPGSGFGIARKGGLAYVGAFVHFSAPVPLSPFIGLNEIGARLVFQPFFKLEANPIGLQFPATGSPVVELNGCFAYAHIPAGLQAAQVCSANVPNGGAEAVDLLRAEANPITVAGFNTGATGFADVYSNGTADFFAGVHRSFLGLIEVQADINGFMALNPFRFQVSGGGSVCVKTIDVCDGGAVLVSSKGLAACIGLYVGHVGGVVVWSPFHVSVIGGFGGSCDVGDTAAAVTSSLRSAGAMLRSPAQASALGGAAVEPFAVKSSESSAGGAIITVAGQGSAPKVRLTAPGGKVYSATKLGRASLPNRDGAIRAPDGSTYFFLHDVPAGPWKATSLDGLALGDISISPVRPAPSVAAAVGGKGHDRWLDYKIRKIAAQRVTFYERATGRRRGVEHVLGTVDVGGRGRLDFAPSAGPKGLRQIVADVEQAGRPRESHVVDTYVAPSPTVPAKPKAPDAQVSKGGLKLDWGVAAGAASYRVDVVFADGRRVTRVVRSSQTALKIPGVARGQSARVTITAISRGNRQGKSVTVDVPEPAGFSQAVV
jgi:hypothetical protein